MDERVRLAYIGSYANIWGRFVDGLLALYSQDNVEIKKFQNLCENVKETIENMRENIVPKKIEYAVVISSIWEDAPKLEKLSGELKELIESLKKIQVNERLDENTAKASEIIKNLVKQLSSSTKKYQKEFYEGSRIEPTAVRS